MVEKNDEKYDEKYDEDESGNQDNDHMDGQEIEQAQSYDPLKGAGARCAYLKNFNNPRFGSDYIVALDYIAPPGEALHWQIDLKLRYIPDRLILDATSFHPYVSNLLMLKWRSLEQLASSVIEDFNNELVPCWVRVIAVGSVGQGDQTTRHTVYCEDRQPRWGNITLLASLSDD